MIIMNRQDFINFIIEFNGENEDYTIKISSINFYKSVEDAEKRKHGKNLWSDFLDFNKRNYFTLDFYYDDIGFSSGTYCMNRIFQDNYSKEDSLFVLKKCLEMDRS